jgi:hypothetical protein
MTPVGPTRGSQLQVQLYTNRRQSNLAAAILQSLPTGTCDMHIQWLSPLEGAKFIELRDAAFLAALGLSSYKDKLKEFWPRSGPRWDALGSATCNSAQSGKTCLLIEGKSYPRELYGGGCKAVLGSGSRRAIESALDCTKEWCQVPTSVDWTGGLYQYGNRLAHLFFLREKLKTDAYLVNLCFLNDPHRCTNESRWKKGLRTVKEKLGFRSDQSIPYTADVFLEAGDRSELLEGQH